MDNNVDDLLSQLDAQESSQPAASKSSGLDYLLRAAGYAGQVSNLANPGYMGASIIASGGRKANRAIQSGIGSAVETAGELGGEGLGKAAAIAGTGLGTLAEYAIPQNELGVAMMGFGMAKPGKMSPRGKPGLVAEIGQMRTKTPAKDIQQAIDDPSVFSAPSVEEANAAYGKAVPNIKGVTKSLGEKLGKTIVGEGDYTEAINRTGRILKGMEVDDAGNKISMSPQEALNGIQSINRFLRNKMFTSKLDKPQLMEINELKDELMDWMANNGAPGLREAAGTVRKAHVRDNLSKLLPQNKYGGNDAMRAWASSGELAGAAAVAISGHPLAAIPLAAHAATSSPALLGAGIRQYHALQKPATRLGAGLVGNAASSRLFGNEGDEEIGSQRKR